jgi:hypothetical protein
MAGQLIAFSQNISGIKHDMKNLYQAFKENFKVLSNETIDETNARKTSTPFQKLSNENIAQILEYFGNKFRTLTACKAILTPVRFSLPTSSNVIRERSLFMVGRGGGGGGGVAPKRKGLGKQNVE